MNRSRRHLSLFLAATLALPLLTSCSDSKASTPPAATAPTAQKPAPTLEVEEPIVWPLTGMAVAGELPNRPAVAIKVENTAAARPQSGLQDADVVWETIVEFEVSRYIAIFHSKYPDEVGPVRSVRPMDMRIVAPLNGVFAYSGGQKGIINEVKKTTSLQALNETSGQAGMWRSKARYAPHNLYATVGDLAELANDKHDDTPPTQFEFAATDSDATAVKTGTPATTMNLRMSAAAKPTWVWDADHFAYKRYEGDSKALTADDRHIRATNVVTLEAKQFDSGFNAQNNAPVPDYALTGSGRAWVAAGGKLVEGTWHKKNDSATLTVKDAQGQPILLAPGNTWVELLPQQAGTITFE